MRSSLGLKHKEQVTRGQLRAADSLCSRAGAWRRRAVLVHAGGEQSHPVKMTFKIHKPVTYGLHIVLTGSHVALGGWDYKQGAKLTWSEGHNWHTTVELPAGTRVEFKCLTRSKTGEMGEWQQGQNMALTPPHEAAACDVKCSWDGRFSVAITAPYSPPRAPTPPPPPPPPVTEPPPAPPVQAAARPPQTVAPRTSPPPPPMSPDATIQLPPDPTPMQGTHEANQPPPYSTQAAVDLNAAILDSVGAGGGGAQPPPGAVKDDMLLLDSTAPPPPDTVSSRQSWDMDDTNRTAAESAYAATPGSNGVGGSSRDTSGDGVYQTRSSTEQPTQSSTGSNSSSSSNSDGSSYAAPAWRMRTARGQNNVVARGANSNMFSNTAGGSPPEDPAAIIARGGQAVLESPHAPRAGDGVLGLKGYELAATLVKRTPRMRKVVLAPDGAARSALAVLTVGELRSECKKRGLPCSGARTDLLLRLMDAGLDW